MVDERLRNKLADIFDVLDPEYTGFISADTVDIQKVPTEILKILQPLLVELESFNEKLDLQEFIESALTLLESRNVIEKNEILQFGRIRWQEKEPSFTPQISQRSAKLANKYFSRKHGSLDQL